MSQYSKGTVTVTSESNRVIAIAGTDWSTIAAGSLFIMNGAAAAYQIAATTAPNASVSGFWELTLTANYGGATAAGQSYVLHTHFAPGGFPLLDAGDTNTRALWNRLVLLLLAGPAGSTNATNIRYDGNGNLMIKNLTTGAWKYIALEGAEGAESFVALSALTAPAANPGGVLVIAVDGQFYQGLPIQLINGSPTMIQIEGVVTTAVPSGDFVYSWTLVSGPNTAVIMDGNQAQAAVEFSQAGQYTIRITVTSALYGTGHTDTALTVVTTYT